MDDSKIACVFGASGLVGTHLVELMSEDKHYKKILVANRSHIAYHSAKIKEIIVDFDKLDENPDLFQVDEVFVCIGTTIKKAGSKEKFKQIDLKLPEKIAQKANQHTVDFFCLISSLGADANSSNFYSKTKGQAEDAISKLDIKHIYFVRPSLLLGDRDENRTGESIAQWFMKRLNFLFAGPLKKYKAIEAESVASAMLYLANHQPNKRVISSDELHQFSTKYFQHE